MFVGFCALRYRKIAGDHCVLGNESISEPVVQPCPVVAPDGLHVLVTPWNISTFPVLTPINFTLLQAKVRNRCCRNSHQ